MRRPRRPSRFPLLRRIRHLERTRALRHTLTYLFCRALLSGLSLLPRPLGLKAGRAGGLLFHALSSRPRRIARDNLRLAFGDGLPARARARMARASFAHAGMIMADAAYFTRSARLPIDRVAAYEGKEHLLQAAAGGRGVLVFSGHFGHWELVALLQARIGVPFSMVVRPLADGRLVIRYGPPVRATRRGALSDDIRALTQECTRLLEEEIRRRPEFWLWMHNRWRTRPAIAAMRGGAAAEAGSLP